MGREIRGQLRLQQFQVVPIVHSLPPGGTHTEVKLYGLSVDGALYQLVEEKGWVPLSMVVKESLEGSTAEPEL